MQPERSMYPHRPAEAAAGSRKALDMNPTRTRSTRRALGRRRTRALARRRRRCVPRDRGSRDRRHDQRHDHRRQRLEHLAARRARERRRRRHRGARGGRHLPADALRPARTGVGRGIGRLGRHRDHRLGHDRRQRRHDRADLRGPRALHAVRDPDPGRHHHRWPHQEPGRRSVPGLHQLHHAHRRHLHRQRGGRGRRRRHRRRRRRSPTPPSPATRRRTAAAAGSRSSAAWPPPPSTAPRSRATPPTSGAARSSRTRFVDDGAAAAVGVFTLHVSNSSIIDNTANSFGGGGLDTEDPATITIDHSTLSGNTGGQGGALGSFGSRPPWRRRPARSRATRRAPTVARC